MSALPPAAEFQNTLFLGHLDFQMPDLMSAAATFEMLPGNVMLAMDQATNSVLESNLFVSDGAAGRRLSDLGTVIASGVGELIPGDRVAALPFSGKRFESLSIGKFSHPGRILLVGIDSKNEYQPVRFPYHHTLIMKLQDGFKPLHDWCLIRRDVVRNQANGLYLPDDLAFRSQTCTLVARGPKAFSEYPREFISEGDRFVYRSSDLVIGVEGLERYCDVVGDPLDYALIRSSGLYTRINDEPENIDT